MCTPYVGLRWWGLGTTAKEVTHQNEKLGFVGDFIGKNEDWLALGSSGADKKQVPHHKNKTKQKSAKNKNETVYAPRKHQIE